MGFPQNLADSFFKTDEAGASRTPDLKDDVIAINHAAAIVSTPARGTFLRFASQEFHTKVLFEACAPNGFPVPKIQASKFPFAGLHIDPLAINYRGAPRSGAPFILKHAADRGIPNFLTRVRLHEMGHFVAIAPIHVNQLARGNYRRGKTAANLDAPIRL